MNLNDNYYCYKITNELSGGRYKYVCCICSERVIDVKIN